MADEQTGGRGRLGRGWASPPGNLYASLALIDPAPVAAAPQLGFVAGVALHEALSRLTGPLAGRLAIKWPNDLLLGGAKLAGILVDGTTLPDGRLAAVIGMGVNLASHPGNTPYAATDLRETGLRPADVLPVLAGTMADMLALWDEGRGFPRICEIWLGRAHALGRNITVNTGKITRQGIFRSLDAHGRLMLETEQGLALIEAGDIFMPEMASGTEPARLDTGI